MATYQFFTKKKAYTYLLVDMPDYWESESQLLQQGFEKEKFLISAPETSEAIQKYRAVEQCRRKHQSSAFDFMFDMITFSSDH
ncbi:hypothetical protein [Photobacterium galatheae]|uniref:Uncharacterized protein n=1 Tax=Photobacterium galatheae TaxID=1654360 RepID=A0A066RSL0_9GAMM|nr:hypothetical protein [Photobacterium galatheae]KDM93329.1 hypothetical protein EA58_01580 [Photobacterium galatheae]MCM0150451.1 hypothetical protein [Photobacterium galatheae]